MDVLRLRHCQLIFAVQSCENVCPDNKAYDQPAYIVFCVSGGGHLKKLFHELMALFCPG